MRIGIDVTPALSGVTGVARYTASLVAGLRDAGLDVVPFAIGRGPGTLPDATRRLRVPLRIVQRAWDLGAPVRAEHLCGEVDVVHSTDLMIPPTRLPLVATVHDVAAIEMPELHSRNAIRQTRQRIDGLHRASVVIANSQATADALERVAGVQDAVVVPLAPYPLPPPAQESPFGWPFLLSVGEITPRKDHVTLVRAFATAATGSLRLVVAGPAGSASNQLAAEIATLGLGERVVLTGRVDDATLSGLYHHARALCMTSREEGFGLPIVEAMQRGLPLIVSDLPALREVAGPAALFAQPGDVAAFASAIESVLTDEARAAGLREAGRTRGRHFSLERTVAGTIAAYEQALACA